MFTKNDVAEGDAPFNMAMMFYYRINELLMHKDKASIGQDMQSYYACLRAVYNNVYFQIKEFEEVKIIKDELEKAHNLLSGPLPQDNRLAAQTVTINNADAREILNKVDRELLILMDKKKMIFPRIEITQGLQAVRKNLGLQ